MKIILCVLVILTVMLTGCKKSGSDIENPTTGTQSANEAFQYVIGDASLIPGTDFADAYAVLGEPVSYTEAASCYFDGMDKIYTYDGFEVRTYPVEGDRDFVLDVCMSSDEFKTDKGITVGSALEDIISAYGEDYELVGKMYRYYSEPGKYMYFFVMNDVVKYFGYAVDAVN